LFPHNLVIADSHPNKIKINTSQHTCSGHTCYRTISRAKDPTATSTTQLCSQSAVQSAVQSVSCAASQLCSQSAVQSVSCAVSCAQGHHGMHDAQQLPKSRHTKAAPARGARQPCMCACVICHAAGVDGNTHAG
jgi:hypothetical protein